MTIGAYENMRRIIYEDHTGRIGNAQFIPVCERCGRFVKADPTIKVNELKGLADEPNATCSRCGRTKMIFEGFF